MKKILNVLLCMLMITSGSLNVFAEEIDNEPQGTPVATSEPVEEENEQLESEPTMTEEEQIQNEEIPEEITESEDNNEAFEEINVEDLLDEENFMEESVEDIEEEQNEDPFNVSTFRTSEDYGGMRRLIKSNMLVTPGFNNVQLTHNAKFEKYTKTLGIDISEHNGGSINWAQVKASGVDFAIIRVGYRGYGTGRLVDDKYFVRNIQQANANGIKVGLYFFSQYLNTNEAVEEAKYLLNKINGYKISLPIYTDLEWVSENGQYVDRLYNAHLSKQQMTQNALAFCNTIANAGYQAGVYANRNFLYDSIDAGQIASKYNVWLAHWQTKTDYSGNYTMWQYGTGFINGLGSVDANVMYLSENYFSIENLKSSEKLTYRSKVQNIGWQEAVSEKELSGTSNRRLRLEAIQIALPKELAAKGNISVQSHVQDVGWQKAVGNGEVSGLLTPGKRLEGIRISLSDSLAKDYHIYYRTHIQDIGWQAWKKDGELSGTTNRALRIEAIEIYLEKYSVENLQSSEKLTYRSKVQNIGWQEAVSEKELSGTSNRRLRLEAIQIALPKELAAKGNISVQSHVQDVGWQKAVGNGEVSGLLTPGKRLEGIRISLSDSLAKDYHIYYRTHIQDIGWQAWKKDGELSGTTNRALRIEAIEIYLEKKADLSTLVNQIKYRGHLQNEGWGNYQTLNNIIGSDKGLRLEAFSFSIPEDLKRYGTLHVQTHVQNIGWKAHNVSDQVAGSTGSGYRLEAVRMNLTDELKEQFDVFYRVRVIELGWLGWTKNGGLAGSENCMRQIESLQVILLPKGSSDAPEETTSFTTQKYIKNYKPIYYNQTDFRWKNQVFGAETFGATGCTPTAMAMVINGILKNGVTPFDVGKYLYNETMEYNHITRGSTALAKKMVAEHWGLKVRDIHNYAELQDSLNMGYLVVLSVGVGDFVMYSGTHSIVLFNDRGGYANVYDPYREYKNGSYNLQSLWSQRSSESADIRGGVVAYAFYTE